MELYIALRLLKADVPPSIHRFQYIDRTHYPFRDSAHARGLIRGVIDKVYRRLILADHGTSRCDLHIVHVPDGLSSLSPINIIRSRVREGISLHCKPIPELSNYPTISG